jgi:hypothetical protein
MDEDAAAAETRKWTLDHDSASDFTRFMSDMPFGAPFFRYRTGMAKIALNAMREHPVRFAMDRLQSKALQAALLAYGSTKLTDKEKEQMANEHPEAIATGRDEKGNLTTLDTKYLDPFGDFSGRRVGVGESGIAQRVKDATGLGDNPFIDAYKAMSTGEDRFGRPTNRFTEILREMAPQTTPFLGYTAEKVRSALKGESPSPAVQRQTPTEALMEALGLHVAHLSPEFEKGRLEAEAKRAIGEAKRPLFSDIRRGAVPDTEKAQEHMRDVQDELHRRLIPWAPTR